MGKYIKYIIEIPDDKIGDFVGSTHLLMPYIIAGHERHQDTGLPIKPYTAPDLERVRLEAYEDGYKTAKIQCGIQAEKDMREVGERHYQRGLSDAWKAVRKIIHMPEGDLLNIFTECYSAVCTALQVILKYDAPEAIEKIRQYEQEMEFKVGDEFENESGKNFVVLKMNGKEIDRYMDCDGGTYRMNVKYKVMRKTGRTFPQIVSVLEKMLDGQYGKRREE